VNIFFFTKISSQVCEVFFVNFFLFTKYCSQMTIHTLEIIVDEMDVYK